MSYKSIIHGCCLVSQKPSNVSKELIAKYISNGNTSILLYTYYAEEGDEEWWITANLLFEKVEIDGVEVPIADLDNAYGMLLLSEGEHTVKYTLKDSTSIGGWAFTGCSNLTSVTIGNSVTNIGEGAFSGCINLTNVILSNKINVIDSGVFSGCESLTNIGPIGSGASIEIPNSVTRLNLYAFTGCNNLTNIVIPDNVTYIENNVFGNNGRADTIIILGNGITNIGENFELTPDLVVIHSTTPPSDDFPFALKYEGGDVLTVIQVPATAVDTYKTAWPNCTDIIKALD